MHVTIASASDWFWQWLRDVTGAAPDANLKAWLEVAAAVAGMLALLFTIYEYGFARRRARRSEKKRLDRARALGLAKELRTVLSEWFTAINEAATFAGTASETLQRLEAFDVTEKYRYRLSSCVAELGKLPHGKALADAARELFPKSAYQIKGQLRMALSQMSDDPGVYKTQKAKAIAALRSVYRSLDQDIDAVIQELA
jgi:hypothetical protein